MIIQFDVPGDIRPWARAGGRGSIRFTPAPQRHYAATIKQIAADAMAGRPLFDGPLELTIVATWLWPKSMSAKKRARPGAELKTTKPDAGNVAKLIEDALNLVVWTDDARVSDTHIYKRLGDRPGLSVTIRALTEAPARPRDLSGFPDIILPSQHMAEA